MIIPLLIVFTIFPLLIAGLGFLLKLNGTIEDETVFYLVSGILLTILAIFSFGSGIEYQTGAVHSVSSLNETTTTYVYTPAPIISTSIVSLSLLTTGIFLIIASYTIKEQRNKLKIDDEGSSSW